MINLWKSEADGLYYFNVAGKNGEIIVPSEGYASKQMAVKGINALTEVILLGLTDRVRIKDHTKKKANG